MDGGWGGLEDKLKLFCYKIQTFMGRIQNKDTKKNYGRQFDNCFIIFITVERESPHLESPPNPTQYA